jgi:glycogen synthase
MSTSTLPTASYDNKIYAKFSKKTIEKKKINKSEFQNEFALDTDQKVMLLGITSELSDKNGAILLEKLLPGIANLKVQLAVIGVGTEKFQSVLLEFASRHKGKVAILEDSDENIRKIYAASDTCLFFNNLPESRKNIKNALAYAALPIAPVSSGDIAENYNPNLESGTSFLFEENSVWSTFAALVRANENFRFPYDWKVICKNALDAAGELS